MVREARRWVELDHGAVVRDAEQLDGFAVKREASAERIVALYVKRHGVAGLHRGSGLADRKLARRWDLGERLCALDMGRIADLARRAYDRLARFVKPGDELDGAQGAVREACQQRDAPSVAFALEQLLVALLVFGDQDDAVRAALRLVVRIDVDDDRRSGTRPRRQRNTA